MAYMRRGVALQSCASLLLAFALAPFQHVHSHNGRDSEVHEHFYALLQDHDEAMDDDGPGPHVDHVDDHASVKPVDNFTMETARSLPTLVLTRCQSMDVAPIVVAVVPRAIEACAHDPPAVGPSIPRAPPS